MQSQDARSSITSIPRESLSPISHRKSSISVIQPIPNDSFVLPPLTSSLNSQENQAHTNTTPSPNDEISLSENPYLLLTANGDIIPSPTNHQ
ncbi:hypothetical protein ENUP19_0041G0113 [Entamoeba nuttalli]|uniref:Uncharacterized protein n=1 Tax=Entamoeba nuttalli TaxID=412467 RepID=A0ABQ0DA64_9EUKA